MLNVFGSTQGQKIFNGSKGRSPPGWTSRSRTDDDRRPTYDDFVAAGATGKVIPATSILAQQGVLDAISAVLGNFATRAPTASISDVLHTLDNYADLLLASCWPPAPKCPTLEP